MMLGRVRGRGLALLYAVTLAGCAAAHASVQAEAPGFYTLSFGRLAAIVAGLVGLTGVIAGGRALARSGGRVDTGNRRGANVAIVAGFIGMALGGLVVVTADGGVGTGNGLGGAIVAMVVGLIGAVLGGVGVARSRRSA